MKAIKFNSSQEELEFYKKVLNALPAFINVNQIEDLEVPGSNINLWANQRTLDYTGFTREQIDEMGFKFFIETMHPDDIELIMQAIHKISVDDSPIHGGIMRLRSKTGEYNWFLGNLAVLERKNGKPWRIIVIVQNFEEMNDTQTQIIQLIKENLQLKNQLRIKSLSKREKEIMKLIAKGCTDKEIAEVLSISPATVKTHRHHIIEKLQVKNKASIAQFATESGLD